MGWFSRIEQPLVRDLSIAVWRLFSDLDLCEAEKTRVPQHARVLHPRAQAGRAADRPPIRRCSSARATRSSAPRARRGHHGCCRRRAFPTRCEDLLGDRGLVDAYRDGRYVTLRLTSAMYHRFHAPHDCRVEQVTYISGDTWNVNPIALARVERLFCRNERAVLRTRLAAHRPPDHAGAGGGDPGGQHPAALPRRAPAPAVPRPERRAAATRRSRKGEEMGWFEHGSTIIVFAPDGFDLCDGVQRGAPDPHGRAAAAPAARPLPRGVGGPPWPCLELRSGSSRPRGRRSPGRTRIARSRAPRNDQVDLRADPDHAEGRAALDALAFRGSSCRCR